jgi:hypothetical protein
MFRTMIFAAALLATTAQAGKPSSPPPVGTASPEVIYTFAGTKAYELRVSNKDGTGAVTLHKGPALTIGKFGPRADKTIAFYSGPEMYLMTYDAGPSGVAATSKRLLFNNGSLHPGPFDFSGTLIAWWIGQTGDLHVYDLATGEDRVVINVPDLAGISFNPTGTEIFFGNGNGAGQYPLHRIAVAGGTPTPVGVTHNAATFDSGHAADNFVIAAPQSGTWYLNYVPAGAASGQVIARAIEGSFSCDDQQIIYRVPVNNRGYDTLVYDVQTGSSGTFTTDNAVKFSSYMPTC